MDLLSSAGVAFRGSNNGKKMRRYTFSPLTELKNLRKTTILISPVLPGRGRVLGLQSNKPCRRLTGSIFPSVQPSLHCLAFGLLVVTSIRRGGRLTHQGIAHKRQPASQALIKLV